MNKGVAVIIYLVFFSFPGLCQETEKNYRVISSTTSCDQLPATFEDKEQALQLITNANFRVAQNFKIRRQRGLKAGEFYSCDNEVGYLVIWMDENFEIYEKIPLETWETLISSNDPEGILISKIRPYYSKI